MSSSSLFTLILFLLNGFGAEMFGIVNGEKIECADVKFDFYSDKELIITKKYEDKLTCDRCSIGVCSNASGYMWGKAACSKICEPNPIIESYCEVDDWMCQCNEVEGEWNCIRNCTTDYCNEPEPHFNPTTTTESSTLQESSVESSTKEQPNEDSTTGNGGGTTTTESSADGDSDGTTETTPEGNEDSTGASTVGSGRGREIVPAGKLLVGITFIGAIGPLVGLLVHCLGNKIGQ